MAWLKFETDTPEKPEVMAITAAMGWDDPDLTVGKLLRVWRWFDAHTVDGNAHGVTCALLERLLGVTGLLHSMAAVGWLVVGDDVITLPNFDRHNGKTAKDRALTAKRVSSHKAKASGNAAANATVTLDPLPREEKRREEEIHSDPTGSGAGAPAETVPETRQGVSAQDQVFAVGVTLLTASDVSDKNARSFLAAQCKAHGPERVLEALQSCAAESAVQPVPWIVAHLGAGKTVAKARTPQSTGKHAGFALKNYREGVEADGSFS